MPEQQSIDWVMAKSNFRSAVLGMLTDQRWHHNREIASVGGARYGGRLQELRDDGYAIEDRWCSNRRDGKEYRLTSLLKGQPRIVRAKIYLTKDDAYALLRGQITPTAQAAVRDALGSLSSSKRPK